MGKLLVLLLTVYILLVTLLIPIAVYIVFVINGDNAVLYPPDECELVSDDSSFMVGRSPTNISDFPYMALLVYKAGTLQRNCAGALINHRYVTTTAHCLHGMDLEFVRFGGYKRIDIAVEDIKIHENYSNLTGNITNDIGLIRLSNDVKFVDKLIRPICIPEITKNKPLGQTAEVLTWGNLDDTKQPQSTAYLEKIRLFITDMENCKQTNPNLQMLRSQLCVDGTAACDLNAGDPVVVKMENRTFLEGIVSNAQECGVGEPAIYTRVGAYYEWIWNNTKP